ncbi:MAG: Ig-like domain-containing protein, partial [Clostridia bacterium]|nr:Ig-like domain-containing protein [Clostridia bacterium]
MKHRSTLFGWMLALMCALLCAIPALAEAPAECAHENSEVRVDRELKDVSRGTLTLGHELHFEYFQVKDCLDCGAQLEHVDLERSYVEYEAHVWKDGACTICGWPSVCTTHDGERYQSYNTRSEFTPIDANLHEICYIEIRYERCRYCDEILSSVENEMGRLEQNHSWDVPNGNRTCQDCGYSEACRHGYTQVLEWQEVTKVVSRTSAKHTVNVKKYKSTYCMYCGELLGTRSAGTGKISGAHEWDPEDSSNACTLCGYANSCAHSKTGSVSIEIVSSVLDVDWATHRVMVQPVTAVGCLDCEGVLSMDLSENEYEYYGSHEWNGSVCAICGVSKPGAAKSVMLSVDGTVTLNRGETLQLNAYPSPSNASGGLTWSTSAKKYATVSADGTVT